MLHGENVSGRIWLIPRTELERTKELGKVRPGPPKGSKHRSASDSADAFAAMRPGGDAPDAIGP